MVGKKRGSPGADEEKNPFDVEIGPEIMDKLNAVKADISRVELALGEQTAQAALSCTHFPVSINLCATL